MQKKKHYWTQTFLVIALMSCAAGIACGFTRPVSTPQPTQLALRPHAGVPKYSCGKTLRMEGILGKRRIESRPHRHNCLCGHLEIGFILTGVVLGTLALLLTSFIIEYTTTEVKNPCKS